MSEFGFRFAATNYSSRYWFDCVTPHWQALPVLGCCLQLLAWHRAKVVAIVHWMHLLVVVAESVTEVQEQQDLQVESLVALLAALLVVEVDIVVDSRWGSKDTVPYGNCIDVPSVCHLHRILRKSWSHCRSSMLNKAYTHRRNIINFNDLFTEKKNYKNQLITWTTTVKANSKFNHFTLMIFIYWIILWNN